MLGDFLGKVSKPTVLYEADLLFALEVTFASKASGDLDIQVLLVHAASASAQAGPLAPRQNFIVCRPRLSGEHSYSGMVATYARLGHIACKPLPWAGEVQLGRLQHESERSIATLASGLRDDTWEPVACRCRRLRHRMLRGDQWSLEGVDPDFDMAHDCSSDAPAALRPGKKPKRADAGRHCSILASSSICIFDFFMASR